MNDAVNEHFGASKERMILMPDTSERIRDIFLSHVGEKLAPLRASFSTLRAALDEYESASTESIEMFVATQIKEALGMKSPMDDSVIVKHQQTRLALVPILFDALRELGTPDDRPAGPRNTFYRVHREPEMADASSSKVRVLDPDDLAAGIALVRESRRLEHEKENAVRLGYHFQAIAAEARDLLKRLPHDHRIYSEVSEIIPRLGRLRASSGIEEYIKGLAAGSKENWVEIATDARQRMKQFDEDEVSRSTATVTPTPPVQPARRKEPKVESPPPSKREWPALPKLRAALEHGPLLLIGGDGSRERIASIKEWFGVDVASCPVEQGAPRQVDALVDRLKGSKVVACIILEGFISHKAWWPLDKQCKRSKVPYAMGGRGGSASIENALNKLERKLGG